MIAVVGHIKKTDGFFGLYRGLVPRLMSTYVNGLVTAAVADVSICLFSKLLLDWNLRIRVMPENSYLWVIFSNGMQYNAEHG